MSAKWRTVRVFISSTFRDMHAERDYLVKRVFPALRERLDKYRIHLVDIDLRWGVTAEQADNDMALDLCLQQIDECKPLFIGILGERYGWVPKTLPDFQKPEYGWVQGMTGKSITELEILHGVLNDHRIRPRAFFFFRNRSFIDDVPAAKQAELLSEDQESADKLARLKQAILAANSSAPPFEYPCRYRGLKLNWRLVRSELEESDREALHEIAADGIVDEREYEQLTSNLRRFVDEHSTVDLDGLQEFGRRIEEQLWNAVQAEHSLPDTPPTETFAESDSLAEEADYHERFMESRLRVFVGGGNVQRALTGFVGRESAFSCLITGSSGSGKSAALAKFVTEYRDSHDDALVIPHFVGASPMSTSLRQMLRRFCLTLRNAFAYEDEVPQETNQLVTTFRMFLERVPDDGRVLIAIDALNQLDETDNAHHLYWLPDECPAHVKCIASSIEDPGKDELVLDSYRNRKQHEELNIEPLTNMERFEIVQRVPSLSAKTLDGKQIQLLLSNPATTNPLFLQVALEELRGFGSYEQLNARIESLPHQGDTITQLFIQVIERLEQEFGEKLTTTLLSLLASARRGLSENELSELIAPDEIVGDDPTAKTKEAGNLFPILRQLRSYLHPRGELLDFFHRNLFKAVHEKYLPDARSQQNVHQELAEFFESQSNWLDSSEANNRQSNVRKVDELPWHHLQAKDWDGAERTLCDLTFIESGCVAGMIFDLRYDYAAIVMALPELREEQDSERQWRVSLSRYSETLADQAGRDSELRSISEPPDTGPIERLALEASIARCEDRHARPLTRSDKLRAFAQFMDNHAHVLVLAPIEVCTLARNHANSGVVVDDAEKLCSELNRVWFERDPRPDPPPIRPACIRTLYGHSDAISAIAISKNLEIALSAMMRFGQDKQQSGFIVWDLQSGRQIRRCGVEMGLEVRSLRVSATGHLAFANCIRSRGVSVWNPISGDLIKVFCCEAEKGVECFAITPDGNMLLTASLGGTLVVWDVPTGRKLRTIDSKGERIEEVDLTVDGERAISTADGGALRLWDITTGHQVHQLEESTGRMGAGVAITPDGRRAVSVSGERALKAWDLSTFKPLLSVCMDRDTVGGMRHPIVAITDNGRLAICPDRRQCLSVWDIDTGSLLRRFNTGQSLPEAVAASPDGRIVATAGFDQRIRVWDLSSTDSLRAFPSVCSDEEEACNAGIDNPDKTPSRPHWQDSPTDICGRFRARCDTLDNGLTAIRVLDLISSRLVREMTFESRSEMKCLAVSSDGRIVATVAEGDGVVFWDLNKGLHITRILTDSTTVELRFLAGDKIVVMRRSRNALYSYELSSATLRCVLNSSTGQEFGASSFAAVPFSRLIVCNVSPGPLVSMDHRLLVVDVQTGDVRHELSGHTDSIRDISVTPDGRIAVSASRDHTVRAWDLATGCQLAAYISGNRIEALSDISMDGRVRCLTRSHNYHSLCLKNFSRKKP